MSLSLFTSAESDQTALRLSVSELVADLKETIDTGFRNLEVEGELSNFKQARSGHCYFTLKDAEAQIDGVMWRRCAERLSFTPEDGLHVHVRGRATVYERRGALQLMVDRMVPAGEGALQQAFERLKRTLRKEGLFDEEHKRPLPPFPEKIGIVTSGESAALQDMLTVLRRRFPAVDVVLCPVPVQGNGSGRAIADAIESFSQLPDDHDQLPDLLIVGRGGGSIEDLWAFNEEVVARAIFASSVPIISGVGHETDVSVADFVADVRAATPSMAAELAVPDATELEARLEKLHDELRQIIDRLCEDARRRVQHLADSRALHEPVQRLRTYQMRVDELTRRLERGMEHCMEQHATRLDRLQRQLESLDPEKPLRRGYARVERDGQAIRQAAALESGNMISLRFIDGTRSATVEEESSK